MALQNAPSSKGSAWWWELCNGLPLPTIFGSQPMHHGEHTCALKIVTHYWELLNLLRGCFTLLPFFCSLCRPLCAPGTMHIGILQYMGIQESTSESILQVGVVVNTNWKSLHWPTDWDRNTSLHVYVRWSMVNPHHIMDLFHWTTKFTTFGGQDFNPPKTTVLRSIGLNSQIIWLHDQETKFPECSKLYNANHCYGPVQHSYSRHVQLTCCWLLLRTITLSTPSPLVYTDDDFTPASSTTFNSLVSSKEPFLTGSSCKNLQVRRSVSHAPNTMTSMDSLCGGTGSRVCGWKDGGWGRCGERRGGRGGGRRGRRRTVRGEKREERMGRWREGEGGGREGWREKRREEGGDDKGRRGHVRTICMHVQLRAEYTMHY